MKDYQNLTQNDGVHLQAWLRGANKAFDKVQMGEVTRRINILSRLCRNVKAGTSKAFSANGADFLSGQASLAYTLANGRKDELYHLFSRLGDTANRAANNGSLAPPSMLAGKENTFPHRLGLAAHGM